MSTAAVAKTKLRDCDHSTRTLTLTLIRTLWSDQCVDAVACKGSRLIWPMWLLCLERIEVHTAGSGCCGLRNPGAVGTTAVLAVYNQLGGRLAYPHVWVRNCLLVVFGIVYRILNISCDIFGIYRYEHREYFRDISIPISCDISNDIDMILHVNIHQK